VIGVAEDSYKGENGLRQMQKQSLQNRSRCKRYICFLVLKELGLLSIEKHGFCYIFSKNACMHDAGVSSVALGGNDKEKLVVVGEEVDSVCLTRTLRKKFKHAMIESVEEVKDKKEEKKEENLQLPPWWSYPPCPPTVVHVPESDGVCIVM